MKKKKEAKKDLTPPAAAPRLGHDVEIVDFLNSNNDQVFTFKQLSRALQYTTKAEKIELAVLLQQLGKSNAIAMLADGTFQSINPVNQLEGEVNYVNPRFAYVLDRKTDEEFFVATENLNLALDGDVVRLRPSTRKRNGKREATVTEIISRRRDTFVGRIVISPQYSYVIPDNKRTHFDIFVGREELNGAENGDKVTIKITDWGSSERNPVGVVEQVLGKAGENTTEMHAIMAEFELPWYFEEEVLAESETISEDITPEEIARRRDFRNITTFTIDPFDAKDFDDAISFEFLDNGHYEIGVHIADVTHYVQPGTLVDQEGASRATSVYLVDRTVPMLPERLSNFLCSLRPHEDKLTFSAVFELDDEGKIHNEWFGRTIIHSDRRFTYEEAQEILEGNPGEYSQELIILNQIAHRLHDERFRKGSIGFETPEVKFVLDENGKPLKVVPKVRKDAHKLVEEYMLLANKKVAEFVNRLRAKNPPPFVYRIHEPPNPEKLKVFSVFAKKFGYNVAFEGKAIAGSLNNLIGALQDKPEQDVLQHLALRTMSKAKYSTENLGHFGLAFPFYSHFTSPIRRYPDMMAHRLLWQYLNKGPEPDREELEGECLHSSNMEKLAAEAERASIKYKQVEFMQMQADRSFDGIVSGVTEWGFYVEITDTKCEGLVRISDLQDDYYELDAENYRLIGVRKKRIIAFGDKVEVRVKATNLEKRTIDLMLVENDLERYSSMKNDRGSRRPRRQ